jgi:hypothetical protein
VKSAESCSRNEVLVTRTVSDHSSAASTTAGRIRSENEPAPATGSRWRWMPRMRMRMIPRTKFGIDRMMLAMARTPRSNHESRLAAAITPTGMPSPKMRTNAAPASSAV